MWQKLLQTVWGVTVWGVWQLRLGSAEAGCWSVAILDWSGCAFSMNLGGLMVVGLWAAGKVAVKEWKLVGAAVVAQENCGLGAIG